MRMPHITLLPRIHNNSNDHVYHTAYYPMIKYLHRVMDIYFKYIFSFILHEQANTEMSVQSFITGLYAI